MNVDEALDVLGEWDPKIHASESGGDERCWMLKGSGEMWIEDFDFTVAGTKEDAEMRRVMQAIETLAREGKRRRGDG